MTIHLRLLVGGAALVAGMCMLASAGASPPLSKESYKKAAEANIEQLQKHLSTIDAKPADAKRYAPTAQSLCMMLAMDAEALGDKGLKEKALKVADQIVGKKFKDALDASKTLAVSPGAAPLPPADLTRLSKYGLDEVMSPFRVSTVGGLNIEKDIRGIRDGKMTPNPADVGVLAVRTAVLLDYAMAMPNDKAKTSKANTEEWTKLSKDSIDLARQISDEAAKGKSASNANIVKLVKSLDAKCVVCHNKYRDD